jgi:transposase
VAESKGKHPGGRPTSYKPEYCEMLVEHMAQGLSFESFAAVTDTWKAALYDWVKTYPEFSNAKQRGTEKCKRKSA